MKENINSKCKQFHQYPQNKPSLLTSNHWTYTIRHNTLQIQVLVWAVEWLQYCHRKIYSCDKHHS